jgi:RNA polymerase sigma factor (sigma-70 family)
MMGRSVPPTASAEQSDANPAALIALTDKQLIARFVQEHDAAALEVLVHRHGPMVFGACRRLLPQREAAEDAFQATFLLLVKKAATLEKPQHVGNWLYGVAYRIARKSRARAARLSAQQRQVPPMRATQPDERYVWRDLRRVLDEELNRLPEQYRAVLVLCYLEGVTNEEAARRLGWTKGTVSGRLARGRQLLRSRLTRRGVALTAVMLALLLKPGRLSAAVPPQLISATLDKALSSAGLAVSAAVAEPVLPSVRPTPKLRKRRSLTLLTLLAVLMLGGTATAAVAVWRTTLAQTDSSPPDLESVPTSGCHSSLAQP